MYACMYVCMYVFMYVCMYVYVYVTHPAPPVCLYLVRIMLETWNFVRRYTQIFSFRKYIF